MFSVLDSVFSTLYNSGETVTVASFLLILAAALCLGAVYALVYQRVNPCSRSFAVALATLPAVVAVVILMVNGSIGAGIAVAGAFSLVRFRSAPGTGKEIAAVFTSMAIGLACGMGCPGLGALFTLILCGVDALYAGIGFGERRGGDLQKLLQITAEAKLPRVKTASLGSLNRLTYEIRLRRAGTEKALIDQLRCRNGNLEISIQARAEDPAEL